MRSFVVEQASDFSTTNFSWSDCVALTCRGCEEANGEERSAFVPSHTPKVGEKLCCPFCGEQSVVPKKARWG